MVGALVIILGLVIGSFLNVCIYRIPLGKSIVTPRSSCTNCGHMISWYENIPVLSYLILRGRCSGCSQKISFRYPLVELLTAAILYVTYLRVADPIDLVFYGIFLCLLIGLTFIDFDHQIIPDSFLVAALIPALYFVFTDGYEQIPLHFWGFLGLGLGFLIIRALGKLFLKQDAMGLGDVKFAFLLGLFFGWKEGLLVIALAFFSSAIVILILLITGRSALGRRLPFGPYLSFG
ncbi:MAG: prepilin peptidase, partial [FCB group bacterium]|nr:prepilin peptidase [FCB group bacterium]